MSLFLTGGVALAYAAGVVGLHRYAVHRRREHGQRFATLEWLDWDTLLAGLLPPSAGEGARGAPAPREGGPPPQALRRAASTADVEQVNLLTALVAGELQAPADVARARFSGSDARWVELLAATRSAPLEALARLDATPANTVAEAYLREWLSLTHTASPLNRELLVFSSKRRVNHALGRFGDHPALYFVRARASGLLGFTGAVLDDLGRAVYFSRQADFYVQAVLQLPFIEEARPALVSACRQPPRP